MRSICLYKGVVYDKAVANSKKQIIVLQYRPLKKRARARCTLYCCFNTYTMLLVMLVVITVVEPKSVRWIAVPPAVARSSGSGTPVLSLVSL
jgi:hypothetical protein